MLSQQSAADAYSGFATSDQNPLLIPYWVPHTIAPAGKSDIQVSTSLFVTNTMQEESTLNESLTIDVETYRLDINLQYETEHWTYHLQIPLITSEGGFLDDTIINWHDAFNMPQGSRLNHQNNQVNIQFQKNNQQIISAQQAYNGIADISFSAIRPVQNSAWYIGLGINIPSGESNPLISNQRLDSALWLSYLPKNKALFLTLGFTQIGHGGVLKNNLNPSFTFAQTGFEFSLTTHIKAQLQLDYHSALMDSQTTALGQSLQVQIGLLLTQFSASKIQLFFSEDILVGSAPDITFGMIVHWAI